MNGTPPKTPSGNTVSQHPAPVNEAAVPASLRMNDILDVPALRRSLEQLADSSGPVQTRQKTRQDIAAVLKAALKSGRSACEHMLLHDGAGALCARRLCHLTDIIIEALYDFTVRHIYPMHSLSGAQQPALVAMGGYGRGTLAPASDIDLMFLLPRKQTQWSEQVTEYILHMLWDAGLKMGHATRTVEEAIAMARNDMTVRTALLETRLIAGSCKLFAHLARRFETDIVRDGAAGFINAKLIERDERHKRAGATRYLVEPNVKESKGGQRDLQTLFWIIKYYYRIRSLENLVKIGILSRSEARIFHKADDFLWAVRCHMHFLAGKAQERLSFDIQRDIAHRLGYTAHPGMKPA